MFPEETIKFAADAKPYEFAKAKSSSPHQYQYQHQYQHQHHYQQLFKAKPFHIDDSMFSPRTRSTSLTLKPITVHHLMQAAGEDSSQSSLNLSASSGYLSGSSANSSNLNLSGEFEDDFHFVMAN